MQNDLLSFFIGTLFGILSMIIIITVKFSVIPDDNVLTTEINNRPDLIISSEYPISIKLKDDPNSILYINNRCELHIPSIFLMKISSDTTSIPLNMQNIGQFNINGKYIEILTE